MSFRRNFTQGLKEFAGGLAQGFAQELPGAIKRIDQRGEVRRLEGRQDALMAYKAALEAGDVATMTRLEQQNPQMAATMANLKASAGVAAQDTAQATQLEAKSFAPRYQGANSLSGVSALEADQLQAQQRAEMAQTKAGRFGGPPLVPPTPSPMGSPGAPQTGQGLVRTSGLVGTSPTPPSPSLVGVRPPEPIMGSAGGTRSAAEEARARIGRRDRATRQRDLLWDSAKKGRLTKISDNDLNQLAQDFAWAEGLDPTDSKVLVSTLAEVKQMLEYNTQVAQERAAELVSQQLQQAEQRKRLTVDDLQIAQMERRKMAETPQLYSPEVLLANGFTPVYQEFIAQIPEDQRAVVMAQPETLLQYREFRKAKGVTDTALDHGEQTLKLLSGMTIEQKYQASMNLQAIEYQKWKRTLDKQPSPKEQETAYEQMDLLARKISGRVDPQAPAPGAGDTPEDYAKQIAALPTEDQQVEMALKIVEKSPAGAREIATSPTITSDRIKQILSTGKDPNENPTPWMQQIIGADLKLPGGGAGLLERVSLVGGGGGPPQGQPQPARR